MSNQVASNRAPAAAVGVDIFRRYGIHLFLVILICASAILSPAFLSRQNISNVLLQVAPLGIVIVGQTFVILVRGLDLSVASVMATSAVTATGFGGGDGDMPVIVVLAIAVGLLTGLANGLLVTKRNVSPFLATLATMIVLQGLRFGYTQGAPSGNIPPFLRLLGSGQIHGIPYGVMALAAVAAIFTLILGSSTFGRGVYITGGGPQTARLVGIDADRTIILCYVISGLLAALAGLLLSGFVPVVDNWVGRGFEIDSIVACVMGGVALSGGRGTILAALVGGAILIVVFNVVLLLGMPIQLQLVVKGAVIVLAAAIYVKRDS